MDDNNLTIKYDLRQTRFSQNYQLSIEIHQKQDPDDHFDSTKNQQQYLKSHLIKNQLDQTLEGEQNGSMVCNKQSIMIEDDSLWGVDLEEYYGNKSKYVNFTSRFEQQKIWLYQEPINSLLKTQNYLSQQTTQPPIEKSQSNSQSSDSEQVFSQKLSLIRSLEQKLSSLHQKIKIPSNPTNYLEECKINLEKEYQIYAQSIETQKNDKENSSTNQSCPVNELSRISQTLSERKTLHQNLINDSIESESMLLDKDFDLYCNEKQIPSTKIFQKSNFIDLEVQIIETIRIVEIPYLIEVNRDVQEKIVSKKSFYFEENEDIHKTFQEFTQKQSNNEIHYEMQNSFRNDTSLNDSSMNPQKFYKQTQNPEKSFLSVNEQSNRTFHNGLKQKREDLSFNYDENNNQILSKLESKNNNIEIEQLQDKVKSLEIENSQLKEKVKQLLADKQQMEYQRCQLAQELIRLSESEEIYEMKLNKYKQTLQKIHEEFAQILHIEQTKLKEYYQKQIQQFENEQSEYANRIIFFEQLFQDQKEKQLKLTEIIQNQNEQIIELHKQSKQKDHDTQNETLKRRQLQQYIVQREKQLKNIIENFQKDNTELNHLLHQLQLRYQSEGFYILNEQAMELKKTLEEKDIHHIEELEKLENRYSDLIEKYQNELENMKQSLQKVRLNKSNSYSTAKNYTNPNLVHYYPKVSQRLSPIRKRQSIFMSKIPKPLQSTQYNNNDSLNQNVHFINTGEHSIDNYTRYEKDISVSHFSHQSSLSQNKSRSSSLWLIPSQLDHTQELLLLELENLRHQNTKLQDTILSEREQKQVLSRKLSQINSTMGKYLEKITQAEEQQEQNEETFMKCIKELQNQFLMNKKLKQKISKLQQQSTKQDISSQSINKSRISINEEQVKVHPIFIQLSNKYKTSKKYIKTLEKQLKDLAKINYQVQSI